MLQMESGKMIFVACSHYTGEGRRGEAQTGNPGTISVLLQKSGQELKRNQVEQGNQGEGGGTDLGRSEFSK